MKAIAAFLIVAICAPVAAIAADGGQPKPKKPPRICKTIVKTGSHMDERLCLTADQWLARAERDAEDAETAALRHREAGAVSGVPEAMMPDARRSAPRE